jgi:hypothetical protein
MIDSHLTDQYHKVQDDLYLCPSSDGLVYMHNPSHGTLRAISSNERIGTLD